MSKKFTYFILLIFCIEILPMKGDNKSEEDSNLKSYLLLASLTAVCGSSGYFYKFGMSKELKKFMVEHWQFFAGSTIGVASAFGNPLLVKYLNSDPEREKLKKMMQEVNIESTKYDNKLKKQKIALQNNPEYQEQQIKLLASKTARQANPDFIALQIRQDALVTKQSELAYKKGEAEFMCEERREVEEIRIKINELREALKDSSLSQEERNEVEKEQAYLKNLYQKKIN